MEKNRHYFNLKSGIIPVNVELYGKTVLTARMALDTGATFTIISWNAAELLGYTPERDSKIKIITASGTEVVKSLKINKLSALGYTAKNLKVICHDLPAESAVDGLLGLDFLKNFNLFINFTKGYVELS
jgi:predicted aspartyl protease